MVVDGSDLGSGNGEEEGILTQNELAIKSILLKNGFIELTPQNVYQAFASEFLKVKTLEERVRLVEIAEQAMEEKSCGADVADRLAVFWDEFHDIVPEKPGT